MSGLDDLDLILRIEDLSNFADFLANNLIFRRGQQPDQPQKEIQRGHIRESMWYSDLGLFEGHLPTSKIVRLYIKQKP